MVLTQSFSLLASFHSATKRYALLLKEKSNQQFYPIERYNTSLPGKAGLLVGKWYKCYMSNQSLSN